MSCRSDQSCSNFRKTTVSIISQITVYYISCIYIYIYMYIYICIFYIHTYIHIRRNAAISDQATCGLFPANGGITGFSYIPPGA